MLTALLSSAQQFEEAKLKAEDFIAKKVMLGGDLTLQYQALDHSADGVKLIPLGDGFNLPTANLNLTGLIAPGVKVHLTTYLSSRHHQESWVKDGYILFDAMTFLNVPVIDNLMEDFRIKIGMMEMNYGDSHFRRSDNGSTINNLFVGNYILDAFTTSIGMEIYYQKDNFLGMFGISNGALKPELVGYSNNEYSKYNLVDEMTYLLKFGYDKQFNDDFRLRATVSAYFSPDHHKGSLYASERAGSRYYMVMNEALDSSGDPIGSDAVNPTKNATSGRWGPGSTSENNAYMLNVFSKYKMFELFATYEMTSGETSKGIDFDMSQIAIEGIARLGKKEQYYLGARYNLVTNNESGADDSIDRFQFVGGWDLTKNLKAKLEYVIQNYNDYARYPNGEFKGAMIEFAVSF